jgi:hypothetical protein
MNSIHQTISKILNDRLQRRVDQKLDRTACIEIYGDIFYSLSELFKQSQTPLSNESVNMLAQMYYDAVTVNGNQELDPTIFTKRARVEEIPTNELSLMATMLNGSPFADFFILAIKKRS